MTDQMNSAAKMNRFSNDSSHNNNKNQNVRRFQRQQKSSSLNQLNQSKTNDHNKNRTKENELTIKMFRLRSIMSCNEERTKFSLTALVH
jgi:hypothetical protein